MWFDDSVSYLILLFIVNIEDIYIYYSVIFWIMALGSYLLHRDGH